jgi:hypothetical protein
MKKLIVILSLLTSSAVFAISDVNLAKKCEAKGLEKLHEAAQAGNCDIVIGSFKVLEIDNRFYSPSKYVWYGFAANCGDDQTGGIQKLVQYNSLTGECL